MWGPTDSNASGTPDLRGTFGLPLGRVRVVEHAAGRVTGGGFNQVGEAFTAPVVRERAARLEGAARR